MVEDEGSVGCGQHKYDGRWLAFGRCRLVATVSTITDLDEVPLGGSVQERTFRRHVVNLDVADATNRLKIHHVRIG